MLALGIPMHNQVLTNPFPRLAPNAESLELSRLVLLDTVPGNGESFLCAKAFRAAAEHGVRGLVAFSDPMQRWEARPDGHPDLQTRPLRDRLPGTLWTRFGADH